MNKLFAYLIIGMFFISLASAESIGTFKLKENIKLYQTCNNCTYCNLTSISYPNTSSILSNVEMIEDGTYYYYNLNGGNITLLGDYSYCYDCGNAVEKETGCIDFTITGTGEEMTQARVLMYLGLLLVLVFLFVLDILAIPLIDSKTNKRNEDGEIFSINNLKYLKVVLVGLAWFMLIAITFIASNLSIAYLETNPLGNLLFVIFRIMFRLTIPMILIFFIWILYQLVYDRKMKRMYQRGFE